MAQIEEAKREEGRSKDARVREFSSRTKADSIPVGGSSGPSVDELTAQVSLHNNS